MSYYWIPLIYLCNGLNLDYTFFDTIPRNTKKLQKNWAHLTDMQWHASSQVHQIINITYNRFRNKNKAIKETILIKVGQISQQSPFLPTWSYLHVGHLG